MIENHPPIFKLMTQYDVATYSNSDNPTDKILLKSWLIEVVEDWLSNDRSISRLFSDSDEKLEDALENYVNDSAVAYNGIALLSLYLVTFKFSFVHHCFPIKTVLYGLLSMSETVEVPQVKEGATTHGTPGQFSKAAFFQRTLISSRLYCALRFVAKFSLSMDRLLLLKISSLGLTCATHKIGSIINSKILIVIL